jgi:hypothetical protein
MLLLMVVTLVLCERIQNLQCRCNKLEVQCDRLVNRQVIITTVTNGNYTTSYLTLSK